MKSAICTLFEGHYHYGVAALTNSLYKRGFRGSIYAGYRGALPPWVKNIYNTTEFSWPGAKTFKVADGLVLYFLPLTTSYHLTNYKPDFMLELWAGPAKDAEAMFYFDPDIVQVAPWTFMEEWVNCGVAVSEDVNSPLEKYHPKRVAWRNYFGKYGYMLNFKNNIYVNGGFVGARVENKVFIEYWRRVQEKMGEGIGGLNRSAFTKGEPLFLQDSGDFAPFGKTDQDALNASIEFYKGDISYITKAGMGFEAGLLVMAHALGKNKPWLKLYIKDFLRGYKIGIVDKSFWNNVVEPIRIYDKIKINMTLFEIKIFSFLNRFYSK
ncbi:MAG: hypothetical protein PHH37_07650 [Paludibacter sp.]|nr:hypothetical protein [Paludibacter sp.]